MGLHRQRVWEIAKGFRGRAKNCIKIARQQAEKALQHAYTDRHNKKYDMRALWNQRINAATRQHGVSGALKAWGSCDLVLVVL
jgi:large subunit ribosomal protein L20